MKKKSIIFIFVFFICFLMYGCKEKETIVNRQKRFILEIIRPDGSSLAQNKDDFVLEESQTYKLYFRPNAAIELLPESIDFEYDETIFEIVCTTTPEDLDYGFDVYYNLTCLKKCESTSFVTFLVGQRDSDRCYREFVFQIV